MRERGPPRRKLKIVLVGDAACGKTALVRALSSGAGGCDGVLEPTIGLSVTELPVENRYGHLVLQLWDTAGEDRLRPEDRKEWYRGADGVLVVCDVTSFAAAENHVAEVRRLTAAPVVALGNKHDLAFLKGRFRLEPQHLPGCELQLGSSGDQALEVGPGGGERGEWRALGRDGHFMLLSVNGDALTADEAAEAAPLRFLPVGRRQFVIPPEKRKSLRSKPPLRQVWRANRHAGGEFISLEPATAGSGAGDLPTTGGLCLCTTATRQWLVLSRDSAATPRLWLKVVPAEDSSLPLQRLHERLQLPFLSTSAATGAGVAEAFDAICGLALDPGGLGDASARRRSFTAPPASMVRTSRTSHGHDSSAGSAHSAAADALSSVRDSIGGFFKRLRGSG